MARPLDLVALGRRPACALVGMAACVLLASCNDVERFSLKPGETYCGGLAYTDTFTSGLVPRKEPPTLGLRLDLDVDNLTTVPGTLTTDDDNDGICKAQGKKLFDKAKLRTIPEVLHDPISIAKIGEGRDQSFWTYVSSSCGHEMMAVVSLMHSGDVEVRLFKPAAEQAEGTDDAATAPGFGLFTLQRKTDKACGF